MSEIKNGRLGLYGAEHLKCNHVMTLGFKGLTKVAQIIAVAHRLVTCMHRPNEPSSHTKTRSIWSIYR